MKIETVHLTTVIHAPIERVFNLSRSIDLHKASQTDAQEQAVAGTVFGLIGLGETVTWQAKHLYKTRSMKVKIMEMESPSFFVDEIQEGDFKAFKHSHHFKAIDNGTIMIDVLDLKAHLVFLEQF